MKNMKKFTLILMVALSLNTLSLYSSDEKQPSRLALLAKKIKTEAVESGKIVAGSILAACLYGIINDSVTVRVCPEYFTKGFHEIMLYNNLVFGMGFQASTIKPLLNPNNKTLISLYWGAFATWWVGAGLGALNAAAARFGSWPKVSMNELAQPLAKGMAGVLGGSLAAGIYGYKKAKNNPAFVEQMKSNPFIKYPDMPNSIAPFYSANAQAHEIGYAGGALVGLGLMYHTLKLLYDKAQKEKQEKSADQKKEELKTV